MRLTMPALVLTLALILVHSGPSAAREQVQDQTLSVPGPQWKTYADQLRAMPPMPGHCQCPEPLPPPCPEGWKRVGGLSLANNQPAGSWGDDQVTPDSLVQVNWRLCLGPDSATCQDWKACTICRRP